MKKETRARIRDGIGGEAGKRAVGYRTEKGEVKDLCCCSCSRSEPAEPGWGESRVIHSTSRVHT